MRPFAHYSNPALVALVSLAALTMLFVPAKSALATPATVQLETDDQKVLYALGLAISQRLNMFNFTDAEVEFVKAGLADGIMNRDPLVELNVVGPQIDGFLTRRGEAALALEKEAGVAFVDAAAGEAGAVKTELGMVYTEVSAGDGAVPAPNDQVRLHYKGTFRNGNVFDSSLEGEPAVFTVGEVVPCFTAGVQMMKVGGKSRIVCPPETAYGDQGRPGIPPGATLIFEIELLEVIPATAAETPETPETPEAPAAPESPEAAPEIP